MSVGKKPRFVKTKLSFFVKQFFCNVKPHNVSNEHIMRSKAHDLSYFALDIHRGLGQQRCRYLCGRLCGKVHFLELIHFSAGFHTAPIHSFHKLSGLQIYDELTALSDKLVGISLRSDGDVGNRRLSAENTCPRNCEHIGFIHTAAGNESRWQGRGYDAAFPLLFGVFCVLHYFTPFSLSSPKLCTRLYILS